MHKTPLLITICVLILSACVPSPLRTQQPAQIGVETPASAAETIAPTPLPTQGVTDTPIPEPTPTPASAETPGLIPGMDLGYECSKMERLSPDSAEAQSIVQEFLADFKEQWPTEYMAIEALWAVDRLGQYALIQGMVTSDEKDAIVVQQAPQGYRMVSRFIVSAPVRSRYTIPEYFASELPDAPAELFYCMDVSRLVEGLPAQELDLNRAYECSSLEPVPADAPEGQIISQELLDFEKAGYSGSEVELGEVHAIVRLEPYLAAQARFLVDGRLDLPRLFLVESTAGNYKVRGEYSGPTLTRAYFLREVYAQDPSLPPQLLACLDLDWFLSPPAPTPGESVSFFEGKLVYEQEGEIWILGLPGYQEPMRSISEPFVTFSEPRLSPSGEWLAVRLKDETGGQDSQDRLMLKAAFGASIYEESLPIGAFAWAPDQDRLAYVAGEGELRMVGVDNQPPRILIPQAENRQIAGLAWSPEGAWIAYTVVERKALNETYMGIWKVPVDGGEPVELYQGPATLLGWTPGGEEILFWGGSTYLSASLLADGAPLLAVPSGSSTSRVLVPSMLAYPDFVALDPAGSGRLAVVNGGDRLATTHKSLALVEAGELRVLTPPDLAISSPAWSPDGRYLAYVAMPASDNLAGGEVLRQALTGRKIWLYDLQTGQSRQLTGDPAYRDEYPLWSADGSTLLFVRMDDRDQASLWTLTMSSGEVQMLLDSVSNGKQGWYYGHIRWYESLDWWRGK